LKSRPSLIIAALVTVAVALLAACAPEAPSAGGGGSASGNQVTDATLTIATTTDVVNYNPLVGNSRSDYWITNLMYPHLLSIGPDGDKQPELAQKWGYDNPTSGYYEIRSGLKWSDGQPLTAKDVAFTLNATKRDAPAGTLTGQLTNFESATAVSDTRVEVKLSAPDSTVIPEVGFWGNIVPQHVFEPRLGVRGPVRAHERPTWTELHDGARGQLPARRRRQAQGGEDRLPRVPGRQHGDPVTEER
jgi:peptide/nickel transport system substrate-binding protein